MSLSTDDYDRFIAQCAHHDPEQLQQSLAMQRGLTEVLLRVAQYETNDPERRELLDELEEQVRNNGLLSSAEDECTCNCSCSSASSSPLSFPSLTELGETNDADPDEPELDPTAPGKILEAAAAEAANDADGEPSSGSLREYRERQANAAEDADLEDTNGSPASLSAWRKTEDGKQATKQKEDRRPSLMDLLRAP